MAAHRGEREGEGCRLSEVVPELVEHGRGQAARGSRRATASVRRARRGRRRPGCSAPPPVGPLPDEFGLILATRKPEGRGSERFGAAGAAIYPAGAAPVVIAPVTSPGRTLYGDGETARGTSGRALVQRNPAPARRQRPRHHPVVRARARPGGDHRRRSSPSRPTATAAMRPGSTTAGSGSRATPTATSGGSTSPSARWTVDCSPSSGPTSTSSRTARPCSVSTAAAARCPRSTRPPSNIPRARSPASPAAPTSSRAATPSPSPTPTTARRGPWSPTRAWGRSRSSASTASRRPCTRPGDRPRCR